MNQINWFKISTKPSDKNIPNIYQIFHIYQIKKLYIKHFENISKFSSLVYRYIYIYIYIPVGNTARIVPTLASCRIVRWSGPATTVAAGLL